MDFFISEQAILRPVPFVYWHSIVSGDSTLASLTTTDTAYDSSANFYQVATLSGSDVSGSDGVTVYKAGTMMLLQYQSDGKLLNLYSFSVLPQLPKLSIFGSALYMACGLIKSTGSYYDAVLFKFDLSTLGLIWSKQIVATYNTSPTYIIADSTGVYVGFNYSDTVSATKTYTYGIARFDNSGNLTWKTSYKDANYTFSTVGIAVNTAGEIAILSTYSSGPSAIVTKLSSAGVLVSSYKLSTVNATSIVAEPSGGFYIVGTTFGTYYTAIVVKLAADLSYAWRFVVSKASTHIKTLGIAATSDGLVIYGSAGTYNILYKLNTAGTILWRNKLSTNILSGDIISIGDKLYLSGFYPSAYLTKLPDNGTKLGTYGSLVYSADATYSIAASVVTYAVNSPVADTTVYTTSSSASTPVVGGYAPDTVTYTQVALVPPAADGFDPTPTFWHLDSSDNLYTVMSGIVTKYLSSGTIAWQLSVTGALSVVADNLGYVYIGTTNAPVSGGYGCLFIKVSAADGSVIYKKQLFQSAPRIAAMVYSDGYVYCSGTCIHSWNTTGGIEHVAYMVKFNATTGVPVWNLGAGASGKITGSQSWAGTYLHMSGLALNGTNLITAAGMPSYATASGTAISVAIANTSGTGISTFLLRASGTGNAYAVGGAIFMINCITIGSLTLIGFRTSPTDNIADHVRHGIVALTSTGVIQWCRVWNPNTLAYYLTGSTIFTDPNNSAYICFGGYDYFARFLAVDGTFIEAKQTPLGNPFAMMATKLAMFSSTSSSVIDYAAYATRTLTFETSISMTLNREVPAVNYFNFIGAPINYTIANEGTVQDYTGVGVSQATIADFPVTATMNFTQTLIGF